MLSPLVKDHILFSPIKLYQSTAKLTRIYTEWLSGDKAWDVQVSFLLSLLLVLTEFFQTKLGLGATVLGVLLSSDKMNISVMTGGRTAHSLLISLANTSMEYQNKASNNIFLLLALLPIPKYVH